ncbi:MAG: type II secretion system protein [Rhizobacter sp.]|nr:type II secretion system protein [Rhizobacter sp.]
MNGFTLIELSVALSIMALLAAVMLPRVAQLQHAARVGKLKSLHGEVSTRVMLVHAAALTRRGQPDSRPCAGGGVADNRLEGPGTLCIEHGLVRTLHAYPTADAVGSAPMFQPHDPLLSRADYTLRSTDGAMRLARIDAADPQQCGFTYTQALDVKTAAAISVPVISGC